MADISRCRGKAQKKMAQGGYVQAARPKAKKMAVGGSVQAKSVGAGMPIPLPAGPVAGPPGPMTPAPMPMRPALARPKPMMKQFRKGGKVKGGC